jgi:hypothetical protein
VRTWSSEQLIDFAVTEPHVGLAGTEWVKHGRAAPEVQQRRRRDLLVLCLQESLVLDLGRLARAEDIVIYWGLWCVQCRLGRERLRSLVHGEAIPQILHLLLHFGIAVALADALEVGLDDASQVLLETAVAAHKRVLLDVALELDMQD